MSKLLDYLNKVEKDVEKWPAWKLESLKNAFQIPQTNKLQVIEKFQPVPSSNNLLTSLNH